VTQSLEWLMGAEISPNQYLAAVRRQDGRREVDRVRKHRFVREQAGGHECRTA
jgi:hypothetical protein